LGSRRTESTIERQQRCQPGGQADEGKQDAAERDWIAGAALAHL